MFADMGVLAVDAVAIELVFCNYGQAISSGFAVAFAFGVALGAITYSQCCVVHSFDFVLIRLFYCSSFGAFVFNTSE